MIDNTLLNLNRSLINNPVTGVPVLTDIIVRYQKLVSLSLDTFATVDGSIPKRSLEYFENLCDYQKILLLAYENSLYE